VSPPPTPVEARLGTDAPSGVRQIPANRLRQQVAVVAAGFLAMAAVWVVAANLAPDARGALAIFALMIIFWLAEVVPHPVTGLIGCYLFWALGVTDFTTAFGGFASPTPWFLFAALLLGKMASESGLARRLADGILRVTGRSYSRALFGFVLVTFVLSPIVPSGLARVAILSSAGLAIMTAFDAPSGGNVSRGVFLVLTCTALIWDRMMISGAATVLARGLIEKVGAVPVYWSYWFLAFLPLSLASLVAFWGVTLALYPPHIPAATGHSEEQEPRRAAWSAAERKCAVLLLVLIGFWMTDFLHHVRPEAVAIGVALAAFLPGINALSGDDIRRFNITPILFAGAALSLGGVLEKTAAVDWLATVMFAWVAPFAGSVAAVTTALYWSGIGYHLLMPNAQAMLSTSLPALLEFAAAQKLNPLALGMIWTFASGPSLMLYQSGIIILAHSYGHFDARDFLLYGLALTIVEFVLLLALVTVYWPLIGLI
jgi:anion transporter